MSKKPPQRKRRKARPSDSSGKSSTSRNSTGAQTRVEKKHVNPLVAMGVLLPVVAALLFLAGTFLKEYLAPSNNVVPKVAQKENKDPNDSPKSSVVHDDASTADVWETDQSRKEKWSEVDDVTSDGWSTEHFTNEAVSQFDKVKKLLKHPADISAAAVKSFTTEEVSASTFRPSETQTVFTDEVVSVFRVSDVDELGKTDPALPNGRGAFAEALKEFTNAFSSPESLRLKIKVFRVEREDDLLRSHQTVEIYGDIAGGRFEENITWVANWKSEKDGSNPRLVNLFPSEYERAERKGTPIFQDCTGSVVKKVDRFGPQMLRGFNHWLVQTQFQEYYTLPSNPGIAIGDVNNDGLEDLFVCQEVGLPCFLLLQQSDGSVKDFSVESGLNLLQNCRSALIVDWNNDGDQDIAIAVTGGIVIASGDGTGKFKVENVLDCGQDAIVLSASDFDLDGKLDLFAGMYWADLADWQANEVPGTGIGGAVNATDGGQNVLLKNQGDWQFKDVTEVSGMNVENFRYSQAASWEDYDNDGDPDLYIANDFGFNVLFRNDLLEDGTRKFVDVTDQAAVGDQAAGMSAVWGDCDRDGWMDLYVSNMYSYAGNRITFQDEFRSWETDKSKDSFQRFARGNSFFRNPGVTAENQNPEFQDLSLEMRVNRARWAWGSRFLDLNNDGWEDLVIANGFITTEGTGDL